MTLSNIKSAAWAYSLITLGTEMLSSFFSFYCVKLFLELYKISELAFYQSQVILMIWNVLNDLSGYFLMNSQYDCCLSYHCSLFGALLHAAAFLLPWFPWRHYQEGDWLNGLHLVVSLCAFDSTLTWVQQAQCRLFAETFPRHESRLQLMKINQVASLLGSTSVLFCGLISHNMEILPNFQVVAVVTAFLAATSLYSGMFHMRHFECKRNPKEAFLSESEQELAWTSAILPMRQILSQRNFHLFLIVNFFQVFHLTLFSNFMMIFADNLIPTEALSSSARSVMYGAGFICPQCLVLLGQSWLKKYGYYKIILISFYLEGAAAIVMLLLGQEYYYCLAVYFTFIMVIVHASFCLFNLPLADMVDADLLKFNRQFPLSLMVFGISALFTRPAQSLAPMLILSKLTQYGYGEPNNRILLDLQDTMFSLVCVVPLGIAMVQILTWSSFSIRNRADYSGTV
ncbi:transmembrane protein 180-like [Peromyscus californicus insignis]|uniref:transmembrane protein 180-like n=1 Tax=Peromyscus californicus insignis TaxID=564181 RepID=UPI0022A77CD8|nr:transmembrane protein 180-like [Peromyscus californicus insignis]